ncbi:SGNH hydrolase-type esterase domain-containing protein [Coniochaeta sp. 2T2.1]|nr:SGNH hydrolase-type esterase domain-containing protein [Coniochaeta sp. 2T2.1]
MRPYNPWTFAGLIASLLRAVASDDNLGLAPVSGGWTAFGDSFAAGIGAGDAYDNSDPDHCRRRTHAHPVVLNTDPIFAPSAAHDFSFLACSGDKTPEVLVRQINAYKEDTLSTKDVATLSIGGNDVGFAKILNDCVFRAKFPGNCQDTVKEAEEKIKNIGEVLEEVYRSILDAARGRGADQRDFRLFVTGYAEFFDETTTLCNDVTLNFWPIWGTPKLTQELRAQLNKLVRDLNEAIYYAVKAVEEESHFGTVQYVQTTDRFAGHRFCEKDVRPTADNPDIWFFLLTGADNDSEEQPSIDEPPGVAPEWCDKLSDKSDITMGDEFGKFLMCSIIEGIGEGLEPSELLNQTLGSDPGLVPVPESWAKTFHPKSLGHRGMADAVREASLKQVPRILIMFQGDQAAFDELVSMLEASSGGRPVLRFERDGIDLRGVTAWMPTSTARRLRSENPQIVGYSIESDHWARYPEDDLDIARNQSSATNATVTASGLTKRANEVTDTDLHLQRSFGDDVFRYPRHLAQLSNPPWYQETYYAQYKGYLHDSDAGSTSTIYIIDNGVDPTHVPIVYSKVLQQLSRNLCPSI